MKQTFRSNPNDVETSPPPRKRVNLGALALGWQYVIALVVVAAVVYPAWIIGRSRPTPAWLGGFQAIWIVVGPALLLFFIVRWLLNKYRAALSKRNRD